MPAVMECIRQSSAFPSLTPRATAFDFSWQVRPDGSRRYGAFRGRLRLRDCNRSGKAGSGAPRRRRPTVRQDVLSIRRHRLHPRRQRPPAKAGVGYRHCRRIKLRATVPRHGNIHGPVPLTHEQKRRGELTGALVARSPSLPVLARPSSAHHSQPHRPNRHRSTHPRGSIRASGDIPARYSACATPAMGGPKLILR